MSHRKNTNFIDELNAEMNAESSDADSEEVSKEKSNEFAALLNESFKKTSKKLSVGDKIGGEILVLGREDVFVATGTQPDGVVSRRDLLDAEGNCPYKVGDKLDLYVTQVRSDEIRLSKNPTDKNLAEDL